LFVCFYVATLVALGWAGVPIAYIGPLFAVSVATALTIAIAERGHWNLGFAAPPLVALRELAGGALVGALLVGTCAALIVLTTDVHHDPGRGFPWRELFLVFLPAALHEELLFRGYPFQKLYRWNRTFAVLFVALLFAALHARNTAVTLLGLTNIFLGGILLSLAYARRLRLWMPIGLHLAWNLTSGPIIGHEVSGYHSAMTIFVEAGTGPDWLTGGNFGIEGSAWMVVVELAGIAFLAPRVVRASGARSAHPKA
jgi:membrane protease YdiL (CAAX protease family)